MKTDQTTRPGQSLPEKYESTASFFRTLLAGAFCLSLLWEVDQATVLDAAELPGQGKTEYALSHNSPESMTGVIVELKTGKSGITNMEIRTSRQGKTVNSGCIHAAEGKIVDVVVDPTMVTHSEEGVMVVLEKHIAPDVSKLAPGECVKVSGDKLRRIDPPSDEDRIEITPSKGNLHRMARMEALSIRIEPILTAGTSTRPAGHLQPNRLPSSALNARQPA